MNFKLPWPGHSLDCGEREPKPNLLRDRKLLYGVLAALGLALYLWPALCAPAVRWSDSEIDLDWARRGLGIFDPVFQHGHPAKPGYLLFLRVAMAIVPRDEARSVVVVQSLFLWLATAAAALALGRRRGAGVGVALYLFLILFLRLRDASSAVMPEALSAALLLAIVAPPLSPPRNKGVFILLGFSSAALFLVRPNVGGTALLLVIASCALEKHWRRLPLFLISFAALLLPFWMATSPAPGGDPLRGLGFQLLEASADYYWRPSLEPWPHAASPRELGREEVHRAAENWKKTLRSKGVDVRRQLLWRALHGLLGTEFYDARWSPVYQRLTTASRLLSPFAILASIALLLVIPFQGQGRALKAIGVLLLFLLIAQNLVLGSNPRYVLPFLPVLFLLAVCSFPLFLRARAWRRIAGAVVLGLLVWFLTTQRGVLDWQWGMIESSGVTLKQRIPKGALPDREPATLHVRVASPLLPTNADLEVLGPGPRRLYSSLEDSSRDKPDLAIPLPAWLLQANARDAIELKFVSRGNYDPVHYLLFPLIPPPWGAPAIRDGSDRLSPSTGVAAGSLDWWAHRGRDE